jgi:hypothetical protein
MRPVFQKFSWKPHSRIKSESALFRLLGVKP